MKYLATILFLILGYSLFGQDAPNKKVSNDLQIEAECSGDSLGEIFTIVEEMPVFQGGAEEFKKYVKDNKGDCDGSGKVFVTFVVYPDGSVHCVKVLRGISESCDREAVRMIKEMPNWKPGKQQGRPVAVQYNTPIEY